MNLVNIMASAMCDSEIGILPVFKFIGNIITFIKIAVPIILIIMGSVDLTKAVMASKEDDIKKAQTTLMKRAIVGVVIFFIPTIIMLLMSMVAGPGSENECIKCVVSPTDPICETDQMSKVE